MWKAEVALPKLITVHTQLLVAHVQPFHSQPLSACQAPLGRVALKLYEAHSVCVQAAYCSAVNVLVCVFGPPLSDEGDNSP